MVTISLPYSLEELILRKMGGREPESILDNPDYMRQQELYEEVLYNQELNKDLPIPEIAPTKSIFGRALEIGENIVELQRRTGQRERAAFGITPENSFEMPTYFDAYLPTLTALGSTAAGGVLSISNYLNRIGADVARRGPLPDERTNVALQPSDVRDIPRLQNEYTYQPRTPIGKFMTDVPQAPFHLITRGSELVEDAVAALGVDPERARAIGAAAEIAAFYFADKAFRSGVRSAGNKIREFQNNLTQRSVDAAYANALEIINNEKIQSRLDAARARKEAAENSLLNVLRQRGQQLEADELQAAQEARAAKRANIPAGPTITGATRGTTRTPTGELTGTLPGRTPIEIPIVPPSLEQVITPPTGGTTTAPTSPLANILNSATRSPKIGGQTIVSPDPIAQDILRSPDFARLETATVGLNPQRVLGGGVSSIVLDVGGGRALRIGIGEDAPWAGIPEVIKPIESGQIGSIRWQLMPLADTTGITAGDVAQMHIRLRDRGFEFADPGADNLGKLPNGEIVIIDPGAVKPIGEPAPTRNIIPPEEPPPTLPVKPTPPPTQPTAPIDTSAKTLPPSRPISPREATPREVDFNDMINNALDILNDPRARVQQKRFALMDIKNFALEAAPRNLEQGLRELGFNDADVAKLLPDLKNVRAAKAAPKPRVTVDDVISGKVPPTEIAIDIPPQESSVQNLSPRVETTITGPDFPGMFQGLAKGIGESITTDAWNAYRRSELTKTGNIPDLALQLADVLKKRNVNLSREQFNKFYEDTERFRVAAVQRGVDTPTFQREAEQFLTRITEQFNPEPTPTKAPRQRAEDTQLAPPTRDLPAQQTMFERYRQRDTGTSGELVPELMMGHVLREQGVTLGAAEFAQMSNEIAQLPRTPEAMRKYMNDYVAERKKFAETSAKLNDGNQLNPKEVSTADRADYIETKQKTNNAYSYEEIMENLKNGVDITSDLPPNLARLYSKYLEYNNKKLTQANRRTLKEITASIKDLFPDVDPTTLGSFYPGSLGPRQQMAIKQLANDAVRAGVDLVDFLRNVTGLNDFDRRLYIEYARTINQPPPKPYLALNNMSLDAEAFARGDFVIKRAESETAPGTHRPAVYNSEYEAAVMSRDMTPVAARKWADKYLRPDFIRTNGIRVFKAAGLEEWYYAYRGVEQGLAKELSSTLNGLKRLRRGFSEEQQRAIGAHLLAIEEGGLRILEEMKIEPRALTTTEMAAAEMIRGQFESYYSRLNEVRASIGESPLDYVQDYFTFMRSTLDLERAGIKTNLGAEAKDVIQDRFNNSRDVAFVYEKKRTGSKYPVEMNAFNVLAEYSQRALEYIHISPFKAKMHEIINTPLKDPETGSTYRFMTDKPFMYTWLNEQWLPYISREAARYETTSGMRRAITGMDKALTSSYIAFNWNTSITQLASLFNTYVEVGAGHLSAAMGNYLLDLATPGQPARKFRMENSKMLDTRNIDIPINEFARGIYEGVMQKNKTTRGISQASEATTQAGTSLIRVLDGVAAEISWDAGYRMGKKRGLSDVAAANLGDDVLTRTQGSTLRGERSVIQRTVLGRAITRFQNYAINNWDQLTYDVLGIGNKDLPLAEKTQRIARWMIGGMILSNSLEQLFGYSPVPNPVGAAYREITDTPRPRGLVLEALGVGREPTTLQKAIGIGKQDVRPSRREETAEGFVERLVGTPVGEIVRGAPIIGSARMANSSGAGPLADYAGEVISSATGGQGRDLSRLALRGFVPGGSTIERVTRPERQNTKSFKTLSSGAKGLKTIQ